MTPKKTRDYNKDYYSRPEVKEAHAKYMRDYYLKNKKILLEKQSKYYVENKDKIKVYMKTYMRNYKPSKKSLLGKDVVNPKSKVIDKLDKNEISSVTKDHSE
jgi:hypothetical protein